MLDPLLAALLDRTCVRCGAKSGPPLCRPCAPSTPRLEKTSSGLVVASLAAYGRGIGARIQRLKYGDDTYLASRLGAAMALAFPHEWRQAILVPVPLHPERLAERGFNQSALLARRISAQLRLAVEFEMLTRIKQTEAQAQLSYLDRIANAQGAFRALNAAHGQKYVLVDDVVTTGRTADACRIAIEGAGSQVLGVVAAATGAGLTHL